MSPHYTDILFGKNNQQNSGLLRPNKLFLPFGKTILLQFYVTQKKKIHICLAKSSPATVKRLELESIQKKQRTQTSGMFACSMNKQEIHLANKQA